MNLKVLWTIAGSMGTLSDLDLLKKAKSFDIETVAADIYDKDSAGFVVTGTKYIVPKVRDSKYIDELIKICQTEKITTIIPQYTDELIPLSENLHRFNDLGIEVLVTEDTDKLKIANSKIQLYQFYSDRDFVPQYKLAATIDSMKDAVLELGYPNVPVCVKPAKGEGGKGFRILTEEKIDIFSEPPGNPKVTLEAYINQLKMLDAIPELLVSEYLPGREYSIDCVCKEGTVHICIPRQRIETSMGVASVSLIEKNEDLIKYSKEIISALNLSYNINIQFKYARDGKPKLIEINPRVSGSLVANYGAGVNMLEAALKLAYGMPLGDIDIKWDSKMIRYWSQIYV